MIGKTVRSVELKLQLTRRILEKEFAPELSWPASVARRPRGRRTPSRSPDS